MEKNGSSKRFHGKITICTLDERRKKYIWNDIWFSRNRIVPNACSGKRTARPNVFEIHALVSYIFHHSHNSIIHISIFLVKGYMNWICHAYLIGKNDHF